MTSAILSYPEVKSLNECNKLVVFLHGLGSDGNDLIGLVPFLAPELPTCHFMSPHAVEPLQGAAYGRQWFPINGCSPELLARNVKLLENLIQAKQKELNLTNQDTIIIGFSQGTMIGLYLNFLQKEPFYAVVGFSGRLILPPECINKTTPICLVHGELDDIVEVSRMEEIIKYLQKYNIPYSSYKIPNLMHTIDSRGLTFVLKFLKER
ncbi:alpha/beta hydrolase [Candidatus Tisiphia endosymbiont of Nemotelus uliginosus]|uniref:alpha/beta hydrolase n=1 Tax=Candidatus Tisiphia endosymbiont of Nemotelus uliginosus TaxID=3077926 RepID=UPI0035C8AA05